MKEPASRTYKDLDQILKLSNINDFSLALRYVYIFSGSSDVIDLTYILILARK